MHLLAKTYGCLPSDLMRLRWDEYQLNAAVLFESLAEDGRPPKGAAVRNDWANLARK